MVVTVVVTAVQVPGKRVYHLNHRPLVIALAATVLAVTALAVTVPSLNSYSPSS